ncbi:MAG: hypothetical protein CH6_2583 [Candidatus Kapaibacterium sp.]|nr:MAG: hypothetical protein CH6_2583 [Candidatus Kapabacteria bacterium]
MSNHHLIVLQLVLNSLTNLITFYQLNTKKIKIALFFIVNLIF